MSMFKDISWRSKDNKKECESSAELVSICAKRLAAGQWSFLGPGSEKKWYSTYNERPRGEWDRVAELMMIKFRASGHQVFRTTTSPVSRGTLKSKGGGKLSVHFCADGDTIETVFAQLFLVISSVSTEQFQVCVRNTVPVKPVRGDPYWQSNLTHCSCQVRWRHTYPWPMILHNRKKIYCKDIENELKSYHNKIEWAKIFYWCRIPDHSWSRTVFHDERHWRILTIYRFSGLSWVHLAKRRRFISTKRLDSREHKHELEVTTCCLQGKYAVEIRIESMNKDHSHSWVRISHGLNKLVTNLNNKDQDDNEQEISEIQFEEYALKIECKWFCKPIKGQSKKKTKTRFCQLMHKNHTHWGKNLDRCWTRRNIQSSIMKCRRNSFIFFVMEDYIEKMMEQLISGV